VKREVVVACRSPWCEYYDMRVVVPTEAVGHFFVLPVLRCQGCACEPLTVQARTGG
jgi:hypothetical protein